MGKSSISPVSLADPLESFTLLTHICKYSPPQVDQLCKWVESLPSKLHYQTVRTEAGGPDTLQVDWNRRDYVCLFLPLTALTLRIFHHHSYKGNVYLVAPGWQTQPAATFLKRCTSPPRLLPDSTIRKTHGCVNQITSAPCMTSLRTTLSVSLLPDAAICIRSGSRSY